MSSPLRFAFLPIVLVLLCPRPAAAAWVPGGNLVCNAAAQQSIPRVAADGSGGAYVVWRDLRNAQVDVYLQRMDANGNPVAGWPANGLQIEALPTAIFEPRVVRDGVGGVIAAWRDGRGGLYAQRVNSSGTPQWTANGVRLCGTTVTNFEVIADGASGAIVAWEDSRTGVPDKSIYARRVAANGDTLWGANGKAVCTATGNQILPTLATDGAGGADIAWIDERGGSSAVRVYAQRITGAGAASWTADGVLLGGPGNVFNDEDLAIASDGSGGTYVAWLEFRLGQYRTFAGRVDGTGALPSPWTASGIELYAGGSEVEPMMIADGGGGALVATANFGVVTVEVDRVAPNATKSWSQFVDMPLGTNGAAVCTDGGGGAFVSFLVNNNAEVHAGRVNLLGAYPPPWTVAGLNIGFGTNSRYEIAMDATTDFDAIVAWTDERNTATTGLDIYCTKIAHGYLVGVDPRPAGALVLERAFPNPSAGRVTLDFVLVDASPARLEVVDVTGRHVLGRDVGALGPGCHTIVLNDQQDMSPGVYFAKLSQGRTARAVRFAVVASR